MKHCCSDIYFCNIEDSKNIKQIISLVHNIWENKSIAIIVSINCIYSIILRHVISHCELNKSMFKYCSMKGSFM